MCNDKAFICPVIPVSGNASCSLLANYNIPKLPREYCRHPLYLSSIPVHSGNVFCTLSSYRHYCGHHYVDYSCLFVDIASFLSFLHYSFVSLVLFLLFSCICSLHHAPTTFRRSILTGVFIIVFSVFGEF